MSLATIRSRTLITLAILSALTAWTTPAHSQTPPATAPAPTMVITPATPETPATAPAAIPPAPSLPAAASAPAVIQPPATSAADLPAVTQPFVATVTGDKVYIRSGPDTRYYETGQLTKGDLVYVVGASKSWYIILPPNGTFGMIAKEYVELDNAAAGGAATTGTVKGDFVNVRTGTAVYKDRDPSAVMTVIRKGTKLKILGATDKYYQIAPPEGSKVYVSGQFIKAAAGTDYKVAQLKLPAGATGPTGITVEAPTSLPTIAVVPTPTPTPEPTVPPMTAPAPGTTPPTPTPPLPTIVPAVQFSETAATRFKETNAKYQDEAKKAPADQNVEPLLKDFKEILAMENISPSVKTGAQADIAAIERVVTVQRLIKEQATATALTKQQSDALREQFAAAERAIAAARENGPYSAQGVLQTSTVVTGKYALVNPQTGRVVAYVDPSTAAVDIGSLIGKYIGVRGMSKKMEGSDITVIQVNNATLMPQPK